MCNLYNVTTTRDAVLQFTKAFRDRAGWNEASFDVYPGYQHPLSVWVTTETERLRGPPGACRRHQPM
jgi:hypothetical protein